MLSRASRQRRAQFSSSWPTSRRSTTRHGVRPDRRGHRGPAEDFRGGGGREGIVSERIEIKHVAIRETPAEPFVTETAAELGAYRAVLDTSAGPITIEFFPTRRPARCASSRLALPASTTDGVHRVAPGFVIQTGALEPGRAADREAADACTTSRPSSTTPST